jgi:hypothetical protein
LWTHARMNTILTIGGAHLCLLIRLIEHSILR